MKIFKQEEIDKAAWKLIKPAINTNTPEQSDGYNEHEVFVGIKAGIEFAESKIEEIAVEFANYILQDKLLFSEDLFEQFLNQRNEIL